MTFHSVSENQAATILLVEDEIKLANVVKEYLQSDGHNVIAVTEGHSAITIAKSSQPAVILLDLNLPDLDGVEVCKQIREFSYAPIIMLTARTEELDRVLGLDAGADDYICKPFSPKELLARVRAILRRIQQPKDQPLVPGLQIDEAAYVARYKGESLQLTPAEFRLLHTLMSTPGRVFSRTQLLDLLHDDYRDITDRAIDSHIRNLRAKLRQAYEGEELIRSVYGVGYKFEY
ncbi:response regulator [Aestuariibacter sp. GS-14]|uniref:response regulator n=1 Tax=Aestuariibacter sp. GS-14 TaxID=2590670 RepID=UPI00112932BB|nr:response regulator [Aestuariibacter sp. GS-14]TPV60887.1 response regulator [Aestuariibacter sp. GS-14]